MQPLIDLRSGKTKKIATIFEVTELIGIGHFAQVYKAYNLMSKTDLAVKIYNEYDARASELANCEISLLQRLEELQTDYFPVPKGGLRKHKIENRNHPLIAMELCEYAFDNQDQAPKSVLLSDLMIRDPQAAKPKIHLEEFWEKGTLLKFIRFLCDAVHMLHNTEIIHRDLKPCNIMIKKPSGGTAIKPFFIDFNTSMELGSSESLGGTESYLPPEVLSGRRKLPDKADDLWALAKIIGDLIFGKNVAINDDIRPHTLINFDFAPEFIRCIIKALSPKPEDRYLNSAELKSELDAIIDGMLDEHIDDLDGVSENPMCVSTDEIVWVRESKIRILRDLINIFCGENELPVLKETIDRVSSIFSSLYQDTTQSFDLKNEVVRLGSDAIPAIIEQSYKLIPESKEFLQISNALADLSKERMELAKRSIELFSVSSDYNVRRLCQVLCDSIHYFPTNLIDSIIENDSLYLPDERVNIADMCIKWSTDKNAMMPLNMYMCKEYIIDQRRYHELKTRIAERVTDLKFDDKAGLIVGDMKLCVWEDLKEYEKLSEELKQTIDPGLRELFADAFSSLGDEALTYVKSKGLPTFCDDKQLPIARAFIGKLAKNHTPARKWLFDALRDTPDKELYFAAQRLKDELGEDERLVLDNAAKKLNISEIGDDSLERVFQGYLISGDRKQKYFLCKTGKENTLVLVEMEIARDMAPRKMLNLIYLLDHYKSRCREKIVPLMLDNWDKFSKIHYQLSAYVLTEYSVPTEDLRKRAIAILQGDLSIPDRRDYATERIEKLLRME